MRSSKKSPLFVLTYAADDTFVRRARILGLSIAIPGLAYSFPLSVAHVLNGFVVNASIDIHSQGDLECMVDEERKKLSIPDSVYVFYQEVPKGAGAVSVEVGDGYVMVVDPQYASGPVVQHELAHIYYRDTVQDPLFTLDFLGLPNKGLRSPVEELYQEPRCNIYALFGIRF